MGFNEVLTAMAVASINPAAVNSKRKEMKENIGAGNMK